jgi:3-methyladenine DNA glycosylase AlkC
MIDIKYYTKLLFNEETGKERYVLAQKEAEKIYNENSPERSWEIAMECYNCEPHYIQMLGVYILGLIGNKKSLNFLKNTVSKNPSWQIQEFLAMAFDNYCKKNGYKNSLKIINEWLNNKNENIRRAVIEGLRIWTKRPYFEDNPGETIKLLSKFKTDDSEYVRKSVGNSLKDISKTYPELVRNELCKWKSETKEINQVYKLANKIMEKNNKTSG